MITSCLFPTRFTLDVDISKTLLKILVRLISWHPIYNHRFVKIFRNQYFITTFHWHYQTNFRVSSIFIKVKKQISTNH